MVPRSRTVFAIIAAPALLTAWVIVCGAQTGDKTMDADMNRPPLGGDAHQGRSGSRTNRLIHEKSPYLLQHAHNPVDWYPWGEEAFERARVQDKPIFLSIGYSTCHWCHVMERESFEDEETADIMNDTFVSIKVDREERPDIDHLYMTVCQMMTGSGGWPLNVVLTPDKRPFFAGTYFPRETRYGRIGVQDFSKRIKHLWDNERSVVLESAGKVTNALRQLPDDLPGDPLGSDVLDASYEQLAQRFDKEHGGFSDAPKFPTPHNMLYLLRYWKRTGNAHALDMVTKTLDAMRLGGIYDHVGFGFHRYSTDAHWLVPHFEKMLYDQALISSAYVEAYQATGKPEYAQTAKEIFAYVLRDMTSSEGGFYSAEDADSEGEEGRFFVWTLAEIRHIVPPEDLDLTAEVFQAEAAGNFAEESTGLFKGNNILHLSRSLADLAAAKEIPLPELEARVKAIREKLYAYREQRVHPHKDDKILTDWNGLMISSLARGAQVFGNSEYLAAARKAADFILGTLRESSGRLLHRYRQGEAGLPAHVDDYAFFISGLIDLYEACFESRYLEAALELNRDFVERFWDGESGGFYFTARDGEALLLRKKEIYDGATPSGNSVAAWNLVRLGRITGDVELEAKAERLFKAFSGTVRQFPSAYTQLLSAVAFALGPSFEVTIAGLPDSDETAVLLAALRRPFLPNKVVLFRTEAEDAPAITKIAAYTAVQRASGGKATAYVCRNYQCELPTADPKSMLHMLGVGE